MKTKTTKYALLALAIGACTTQFAHADEANDLINKILNASPSEKAKATQYKSHSASKKKSSGTTSDSLGIPESQLLEASSKFPPDTTGKYVYGIVTFNKIVNNLGEPCILFRARNGRILSLYTQDPAVIAAFDSDYGTQYSISKSFPLRIVGKTFLGMYSVRMPYDKDTSNHGLGEMLNKAVQQDFGTPSN